MWGSDQALQIVTKIGISPSQTQADATAPQLARIDYARPETWSFFFGAKLTRVDPEQGTGSGIFTIDVFFDVAIGLGRSTQNLFSFESFKFAIDTSIPPNGSLNRLIWSTRALAPSKSIPVPATPDGLQVESFCAQSINCSVRAHASSTDFSVPNTADLVVSAFFCPRTHIRPEWFQGGRFTGGEDYGS